MVLEEGERLAVGGLRIADGGEDEDAVAVGYADVGGGGGGLSSYIDGEWGVVAMEELDGRDSDIVVAVIVDGEVRSGCGDASVDGIEREGVG